MYNVVVGSPEKSCYSPHFLLHKPPGHGLQLFARINIANDENNNIPLEIIEL
jgi:hypothetical protein